MFTILPDSPSPLPKKEVASSTPSAKKGNSAPLFDLPGNKIFFFSLGCPRNLVDSEVMLGILLQAGYEVARELEESDFIIVNTCGFLEASRVESEETIERAMKARKKGAKVIVTGCMVRKNKERLTEKFPEIGYFLGAGDVTAILEAVEAKESGAIISSAKSYLEAGEVPRKLSTPKHYAYLKIAEGCRKACAYCIIPQIKGPLKSKPIEQVAKEFSLLLRQGVKEIILIAQDLGDFGKDQGRKGVEGLIELLRRLLQEEGDFWLRLLYLYPDEISDELIQLMKSDRRICPYLDMPIQHINSRLLSLMRRNTSKEQIVKTISTLRKEIPDIAIRTSLIVGFPSETEEEFEELCDFIKKVPLDNVGIFPFSREEGSRAYSLEGQIDDETKERRLQKLAALQKKSVAKLQKKWIGRQVEIILEGHHPESSLLAVGRTNRSCPEIDGQVIINDFRKAKAFGNRYVAEITDVAGYDLIARIL